MNRVRAAVLFVVLALIDTAVLLAPPAPESLQPPPTPEVIQYDSDALSWPGVIVDNDMGTPGGDGQCTFQDSGSGSPVGKDHVTIIDTVSIDPSTCTRRVATATYPVTAIPDSVWVQMDPSITELITARALVPVQRTILPVPTWTGSVTVTVRDPLNLIITQTVVGLTWTSADERVTSWEPTFEDSWATWSGWSRYAGRFDASGNNDQYAYATTSAYYRNDLFCPGRTNTTYSNHWITYFQGRADGSWQWRRVLNYSGGCSWMLHDTVTLITP